MSGPSSPSPPDPSTPRAASSMLASDGPGPADTVSFQCSCRCSNITIAGKVKKSERERIEADSRDNGSNLLRVWLDVKSERLKQRQYVKYDSNTETRGRERDTADRAEAWRRCTLCDVRVYKVPASEAENNATPGARWVEVDLNGDILYGRRLSDSSAQQPSLPFSGLRLPLEAKTSNFGRPPQTNFPQLYPPANVSPSSSSRTRHHLIPTVHDPFFLPPPFIPSHPHLKELCSEAVTYLQETHDRYEAEVSEFVSKKAAEMRDLEDKVRCEVEMLWNAFVETDEEGRISGLSRRGSRAGGGSRSKSREPVRTFSPSPAARTRTTERPSFAGSVSARPSTDNVTRTGPAGGVNVPPTSGPASRPTSLGQSQNNNNPILNEAAANPAYPAPVSSLLSASITANAHQAQEPAPVADIMDDSLARVSQTYDKREDARAVAMSHVFSVLDDAMANKKERRRSRSRSTGNGSAPTSAKAPDQGSSAGAAKDSWIDSERLLDKAAAAGIQPTIEEESAGVTSGKQTPRPGTTANKEVKRTVTFQDDQKGPSANGTIVDDSGGRVSAEPSETSDHDEDHVFDFEPHDEQVGPSTVVTQDDRVADPFEQEISTRYAAHAPSHRSAWKRPENGEAGYSWYRKGDPNAAADRRRRLADGDEADEAKISGLATSMPVHIALPKMRKASGLTQLERKTSLSEREGRLVPPLMAAMKQRGLDVPTSQADGGGTSSRRVSTTVGTAMDPGVLHDFATGSSGSSNDGLADGGGDGDDDEDEEEDQQGTLRQSGFIPPHVIARNRQSKGVDGVRSIYDE